MYTRFQNNGIEKLFVFCLVGYFDTFLGIRQTYLLNTLYYTRLNLQQLFLTIFLQENLK